MQRNLSENSPLVVIFSLAQAHHQNDTSIVLRCGSVSDWDEIRPYGHRSWLLDGRCIINNQYLRNQGSVIFADVKHSSTTEWQLCSSFSSITESTLSLNIITVEIVNFLGIQSNRRGDGGIYVHSIINREAVDLDGRIEPGDMLLQVNDVNIENMSNDDAVRVLREMFHKPGPTTLTVAKCWDPTPKQCLMLLPKLGTPVAQYGEQPNSQSITTVTSTSSSMTSSLPVSDGIPCCVIVGVSRKRSHTSVLYACKVENGSIAEGNPVCLVKPDCSCIWQNDEINEKRIVVGAILKYHIIGDLYIYFGNTEKKMDVDKIQMDLEYGVNAYKGIKDAITTKRMGCYLPSPSQPFQSFLIAIAGGIKNESITFLTKSGEYVTCPLNCRKHLTMSASPSVLQPRPLTEKDDVGDVAVIKCNSAMENVQAVCEGLILKYDPKVISIDEEPVEIKNADGVFVLCPGMVTFDTGNTAATSISNEVLNILKLKDKVDHTKPFRYTAAGRNGNKKNGGVCSRVWIELKIRRLLFRVFALVDVAVENVDLLIGMDVINILNVNNFTLGK